MVATYGQQPATHPLLPFTNRAEENHRGQEHSGENLTGIDLSQSVLVAVDFRDSNLSGSNLKAANLTRADLTNANLKNADLSNADLTDASLVETDVTGSNFSNALIRGANLWRLVGFTQDQLQSTSDYQRRGLQDVTFRSLDPTGWSFAQQDLTTSRFADVSLRDVDMTDAIVAYTSFYRVTDLGFTASQLYFTLSYQEGQLTRLRLNQNNLVGWNFVEQNLQRSGFSESVLTNAQFRGADLTGDWLNDANLTNADFTDAIVANARFDGAVGITQEQLYYTESYKQENLAGIRLGHLDLRHWDLAGQDLTKAQLGNLAFANLAQSTLTLATIGDLTEANITQADLSEAELRSISLRGAKAEGAVFSCATLFFADFAGADLRSALFDQAELFETNFSGAKLANASFQNVPALAAARFDSTTTYNQWTIFPDGFDPVSAGLTYVESPRGDINADQEVDVSDIDLIAATIRSPVPANNWHLIHLFDLNLDKSVDSQDQFYWVHNLVNTYFGDVNMDGEFNSTDLVLALQGGEYEDSELGNSTWAEGDWNGDGDL
ncbi:MAG: pentapeptide repeat-containing protein, partial [Planctomycetales bacterium]|nr:pentapeptide repeat-containing protein [Planctomycetales bacterium]